MAYQAPKGTRDVTPAESYRWQYVEELIRKTTARYGFREVRTPVIEHTELFLRSVGDNGGHRAHVRGARALCGGYAPEGLLSQLSRVPL